MGHGYHVPKLCVEITEAQQSRIKQLFPHGTLKPTVGLLLDEILALMELHGSGAVIGAVISRQASLAKILPTLQKVTAANAQHTPPKEKF